MIRFIGTGIVAAMFVAGAVGLIAIPALAQGGTISPDADLTALIQALMDALRGGNWLLAVPAIVLIQVALTRKFGQTVAGLFPPHTLAARALLWLTSSRWGGWTLNLLTTAAVTFSGAAASGVPLTVAGALSLLLSLVVAGLKEAMGDVKAVVVSGGDGGPPAGSMVNR